MSKTLQRFRWIGMAEGTSFLLLLFIAMPLKYLAGFPQAVSVVGMAHGVLFLGYVAALLFVASDQEWKISRTAFGFVAAVIPFGPFLFDRSLKNAETDVDN